MVSPPVRVAPYLSLISVMSVLLLLLAVAWAGPAKAPAPPPPDSLIAIGDVHGDFDDFVGILQRTGLIDKQNHWAGGKTTFVQVGDLLDRGPKPRQVMDLMIALENEAGQAGGRVVSLLGNHEVMNIMGDLRYVTLVNYASFADSNSAQRQKSAYDDFVKWSSSHQALLAELPQPMELTEAEWMARHPPGFVEQREALGPKGTYGQWLRGHSGLAQVGGNIFLHGGIHPDVAKTKLDAINDRVRNELKSFDSAQQYFVDQKLILPFFTLQEVNNVLQAEIIAERKARVSASDQRQNRILEFLKREDWLTMRPDGPFWFRGYDSWTDEEGGPQVDKILGAYKATHIVVGHTVQKGGRIRPRFDNKVFLIDTGMLSSYYPGGRASALEICGGTKVIAEYMDQQVVLVDAGGSPPNGGTAAAGDGATANGAMTPETLANLPPYPICPASSAATQ